MSVWSVIRLREERGWGKRSWKRSNAKPHAAKPSPVAHRVSKDEACAMLPMFRIGIYAIQASKLSRGCPRLPFGKDPCEVNSRHVLWLTVWWTKFRFGWKGGHATNIFSGPSQTGTDLSKQQSD